MKFVYLTALLVSLTGMVILDKKYRLAFFADARRSALTIAVGVAFFAIWDIAGILLDIFYTPGSSYSTGWQIAPNFPVEELFFLVFLCYFTLILYRLGARQWPRI